MAYLRPDPVPISHRLMLGYETDRQPLLERGISLGPGPDLAEFREQLTLRQRHEELAAAEAALAEASALERWRLRRRGSSDRVATDPQLRPVTWAVARRGPRRDLEDAFAHRGTVGHAYVVNSQSVSAAVCGYRPPLERAGGARIASLAAASLETNPRCTRCLVLLYQAALEGETDQGRWPTADLAPAAAQPAATVLYADPLGRESTAVAEAAPEYPTDSEEVAAEGAEAAEEEEAAAPVRVVAIPVGPGEPEEIEPQEEMAEALDIADRQEAAQAEAAAKAHAAEAHEVESEVEAEEVAVEYSAPAASIAEQPFDPLGRAFEEGVEDVLVITAAGARALLTGGVGRGADWAGTVLDLDHEPLLRRVWASTEPLRRDGAEVQRICGPFWARSATLVPVGDSACVVFGADAELQLTDDTLQLAAQAAVGRFQRPAPENVLADERELTLALRRIMEGSDLSFEAALGHVLTTTASVLGCAVAAGSARMGRRLVVRAIDLDDADQLDPGMLLGGGALLAEQERMSIEESLLPHSSPHLPGIVARLRLPLHGENMRGMLVLTHTVRRPRGFTSQDQRLAEAIAPAAVLLLERAGFGEGLRALESHMHGAPATDPLTGLANQAAWEQVVASEAGQLDRAGGSVAVAALRIEGLGRLDERQGPLARDAALRQAAELLRGISRSSDVAARVGEDEFRVLLRNPGTQGARRLVTRIRRAARTAQASSGSSLPPLTISWANAGSRAQLLQASRIVGQRLRTRGKTRPDQARLTSGR
ncbi:MAG: GGDEF domain-containing protein, partial [Chloroflexota bacterium]|nr:GGDEF domain-containing protein [Chloroflexota bacterium]